jgi:hypothetical protein
MELYQFLVYRLIRKAGNTWSNRLYNNNSSTRETTTINNNLVFLENPEEKHNSINTRSSELDHSSNPECRVSFFALRYIRDFTI